jgi:hypothetical protein
MADNGRPIPVPLYFRARAGASIEYNRPIGHSRENFPLMTGFFAPRDHFRLRRYYHDVSFNLEEIVLLYGEWHGPCLKAFFYIRIDPGGRCTSGAEPPGRTPAGLYLHPVARPLPLRGTFFY